MATKRITTSYLAIYLVAFVAILLCFYFIPSGWIETLTAQTTAWTLTVFGHTVVWNQVNGYTTLTLFGQHSVTVSIIRECTALNVLGVMAGLILPLKASWVKRASGFVLSSLLLFTLNIPRIAITVYLTAFDTWPFTLIANRNLDTYHYPISFAFGVIGVAVTILAVSKWTTPELADTILSVVDKIFAIGKKKV
jgi:exosortase/archaeosortase family protein